MEAFCLLSPHSMTHLPSSAWKRSCMESPIFNFGGHTLRFLEACMSFPVSAYLNSKKQTVKQMVKARSFLADKSMASLLPSPTVLLSDSFPRLIIAPLKTLARNPSSWIKATASTESDKEEVSNAQESTEPKASTKPPLRPKKPQYSMQKGQIVRVDKEKYLSSINYLSVGHPPYYKGLDYIYEDRGEVLDIRIFETGEYALIAWVGIPTAPAWLPTYMLIKSEKLDYERI